ncbi:hypothetical protein GGX14DRAFT_404955 [Mycena pura]|uniref:Uncharacterized protein n=1 Tax=Mycena pura TaxID=153505 RepID=A0AAD6UWF1_9AGAR|nr:hypothetical protein GGX14DRAFT_404955 [Mycena pura]
MSQPEIIYDDEEMDNQPTNNINAWIGRLKPGFEPPPAAQAVERSLLTIPPAVLKQLPPQSLPIAELLRYTLLPPQFTDSIRNDEREAIVKAAAALSTVKRKGGKGVGNVLDVDEDDGVAEYSDKLAALGRRKVRTKVQTPPKSGNDLWAYYQGSYAETLKYEDDCPVICIPDPSLSAHDQSFIFKYDRTTILLPITSLRCPWHPVKTGMAFRETITFLGLLWDLRQHSMSLPERWRNRRSLMRLRLLKRRDGFQREHSHPASPLKHHVEDSPLHSRIGSRVFHPSGPSMYLLIIIYHGIYLCFHLQERGGYPRILIRVLATRADPLRETRTAKTTQVTRPTRPAELNYFNSRNSSLWYIVPETASGIDLNFLGFLHVKCREVSVLCVSKMVCASCSARGQSLSEVTGSENCGATSTAITGLKRPSRAIHDEAGLCGTSMRFVRVFPWGLVGPDPTFINLMLQLESRATIDLADGSEFRVHRTLQQSRGLGTDSTVGWACLLVSEKSGEREGKHTGRVAECERKLGRVADRCPKCGVRESAASVRSGLLKARVFASRSNREELINKDEANIGGQERTRHAITCAGVR